MLFTEFCDAFKFRDLIQFIVVRMISIISFRANQSLTDSNFTIDSDLLTLRIQYECNLLNSM